jgi:hypothetical protein
MEPPPPAAEQRLAAVLARALRDDFLERDATAQQLAGLLLDTVEAALPLTDHRPAEPALAQLEGLATSADVFAWDGAPGWDEVLARGLLPRPPVTPGSSVLDGIGAQDEREAQRGELKRRARAEASRLLHLGRSLMAESPENPGTPYGFTGTNPGTPYALPGTPPAHSADGNPYGVPTFVVRAHAAVVRLVGQAVVASLLFLPEDLQAGALPPPGEDALAQELTGRTAAGSELYAEEWLARLLQDNPAAAAAPGFRTFFAGLSYAVQVAPHLLRFRDEARAGGLPRDPEALLGAVGGWQPVRWAPLRHGAPSAWISQLCPAGPLEESPLARLARECSAGLDLLGRLWSARGLSLTGFTALAALYVARCASAVALWEELAGEA